MKIRKWSQTIDEWGRLITPDGIIRAVFIRWELFPQELRRKLVFTDKKTGFIYIGQRLEPILTSVTDNWIRDGHSNELELLPNKNPDMMKFVRSKIRELQEAIARSDLEPVLAPAFWFNGQNKNRVWFFKQDIYLAESSDRDTWYTTEQIKLLVLEFYDRERRRFEKLKSLYDSDETAEPSNHRERIPERVRIEVWRRDGGKCARCGSREKLEYDHIVPVSKGGSNTARNIELLCESCNRKKSNYIA
jgi:hypothetical protein